MRKINLPTVKNHQELVKTVRESIRKELRKINTLQRIEFLEEIIDVRIDEKQDILVTVEKGFIEDDELKAIETGLHEAFEDQFSADEDIWVTNTSLKHTKFKYPIPNYIHDYFKTGNW
jgi:hypothetical protein